MITGEKISFEVNAEHFNQRMVDGGFLFQNRKVSGWQHEKCLAEKWFPESKITKATSEMFTSLKLFSYIPLDFTVWFGLDHERRVCSRGISLPFCLFFIQHDFE